MIELNGEINAEGKAHIFNQKELTKWFADNAGKRFTIKVERLKKKRSTPQNAYYWGVVVPMVRERLYELGNECTTQDTHEVLKAKFNTIEVLNTDNVSDEIVQSTKVLSTVGFMEYLDKIQRWANQFLGIVIPNPNEQVTLLATYDKEVSATIVEKG
jgi:hypothetical protein